MEDEKLQFGIGLKVDMDSWREEWRKKETEIQKVIDQSVFDVRIGNIKGLDKIQEQLKSISNVKINISTSTRSSRSMRDELMNIDSIKALKAELKNLEDTWTSLSKAQKFYNEQTRELTPFANELVMEYSKVSEELKRYGMTLKEVEKAGLSYQANLKKITANDIIQPPFELLQMREYYKSLEESSARTFKQIKALEQKEQEGIDLANRSRAEAIVLQKQIEDGRNREYEALKRQIAAEAELAEQQYLLSVRREAWQNVGQKDFTLMQMAEYYSRLEETSARAAAEEAELNRLIKEEAAKAKELWNIEVQRGEDRFKESRRLQAEKEKELKQMDDERRLLREQLINESKLASQKRKSAQLSQMKENSRRLRILQSEEKTLGQINAKLALQRERLQNVAIGSSLYNKIYGDVKRLEAELAKYNGSKVQSNAITRESIRLTDTQTQAYRKQSGVLNGLKQFLNSYISLLGAYRLVKNIKDITSEFELQRVSLRAITQDVKFADRLFARIKTTAIESPFSTKDLVTYTKQLAAYRIENDKLFDTMNMLSDVSAGLGISMDRLILAFGQVKAASVLRGQELRQFT